MTDNWQELEVLWKYVVPKVVKDSGRMAVMGMTEQWEVVKGKKTEGQVLQEIYSMAKQLRREEHAEFHRRLALLSQNVSA